MIAVIVQGPDPVSVGPDRVAIPAPVPHHRLIARLPECVRYRGGVGAGEIDDPLPCAEDANFGGARIAPVTRYGSVPGSSERERQVAQTGGNAREMAAQVEDESSLAEEAKFDSVSVETYNYLKLPRVFEQVLSFLGAPINRGVLNVTDLIGKILLPGLGGGIILRAYKK